MSEAKEEELSSLTVAQLRELCKNRGLKVGGVKKEIIERLIESEDDNNKNNNNDEDEGQLQEAASPASSADDHSFMPVNRSIISDDGDDDCAAEDNNDDGVCTTHEETPTTAAAAPLPRSGVAEDAELLAELKAISNKSGSSGRFRDEDDNHFIEEEAHDVVAADTSDDYGGEQFRDDGDFDDDAFLPNATIDVEDEDKFVDDFISEGNEANYASVEQQQTDAGVMADDNMHSEVTAQPEDITNAVSSSDVVHDGQLLANDSQHMGITSQARFDDDDGKFNTAANDEEEVNESVSHDADDDIQQQDDEEEVIDRQLKENVGIKSNLPNTFNGKNGGIAEDADLLAELRAISNKTSASRFDSVEDDNGVEAEAGMGRTVNNDAASTPPVEEKEVMLPPWKQKNTSMKKSSTAFHVDVLVAASPAPASIDPFENVMRDEQNVDQSNVGIKSSSSNTFNGKNGGVAEDADLLAELRAISNKASVNRFDGADILGTETVNDTFALPLVEKQRMDAQVSSKPLPPWKQKRVATKKQSLAFDVDVVVAAAPTPAAIGEEKNIESPTAHEQHANEPPTEESLGIKSSLPNTFNGKNGGVAEDADLLAELRAISNKASGSRFDGEADGADAQPSRREFVSAEVAAVDTVLLPSVEEKESDADKLSRPLPPSKRKHVASKTNISPAFDVNVVVAAVPAPSNVDPFHNIFVEEENCEPTREEKPQPSTDENFGIKSGLPNTFKGKNGGIAEDADLLAELRAISNKASGSRFDDGDVHDNNAQSSFNEETKNVKALAVKNAFSDTALAAADAKENDASNSSRPLPPWKRKGATVKKNASSTAFNVDVVVAAAPNPAAIYQSKNPVPRDKVDKPSACAIDTPNDEHPTEDNMGIKSTLPNTFKGKNGGVAEDADLLAELRAISNKASSSRFDFGGEDETTQSFTSGAPPVEEKKSGRDNGTENVVNPSKSKTFAADEKPWKKKSEDKPSDSLPHGNAKQDRKNSFGKSHPGSVSNPFQNALPEEPNPTNTQSSRCPSHLVECATQRTFSGKNGGAAEDAELLAELKAISNKSSIRFVDTDDISDAPISESNFEVKKAEPSKSLPPLKQKAPSKKVNVELSVHPDVEPKEENMGIKSTLPTTFKGKNGGTAEDADLLAELRAISMKNSSSRFSGDYDEECEVSGSVLGEAPAKKMSSSDKPWKKSSKNDSRPLPPWKQKGAKKIEFALEETDNTTAAPSIQSSNLTASTLDSDPKEESMGIKSQFANTFKGARGGTAEDADILAELRAISKNSSSNRFADTEDVRNMQSQNLQPDAPTSNVSTHPKHTEQNILPSSESGGTSLMTPFPTAPVVAAVEINITLDGLDESLASSNWQVRKASYLFLQEKILKVLSGREPENQLVGDDVYSSLDSAIMKGLDDKNAGALDSALTLSITYSDCCKGACSEDNANRIMSLLLKGAAFASSRPSTLNATQELVFKLVEVAPEGSSNADNIVDLIQLHGLKAKKPKVVQFAATLVLQLVQEFGTSVFNVSKLSSVHETLVGNSNDKIRAVGIEVLAELCRTFGSKTPMQALVDKLKKSQQSQLDSILEKQPTATPPTRRLRCKRGVQLTAQSPEEALVALKKNEEEEKLKRFASRPAVNLLQVLPQTCYKHKIKEAKWSEKVEALNALIEAGGEQPYKISNGNYTTLFHELKQLLSHTHYLVCSRALAAIGMLAEGVGEPIASELKPLLPTVVPLFKDKKVGNAVMSCLDQMFGNALRFDHFLGSNDSILSSLDEKKEKNALVRKSLLEFLSRCVVSSGTYGSCGKLNSQHAEDLCKIACDKLKDSDSSTRKAATDVLIALLNSKDEAIIPTVDKVTLSLQVSNPRAFKALHLATKSGKPDASSNGASRPGTAPFKPTTSSKADTLSVTKGRPTTAPKSKTSSVPSVSAKSVSTSGAADEKSDESALPSLDESIESLSALGIPKWGDDADNGGVLAGIQCKILLLFCCVLCVDLQLTFLFSASNWKQRMDALNNLAAFYESKGNGDISSITPLFVLVKTCTKSFQESNFNVAKAILDLFRVVFNVYAERQTAPESFIYVPIVKLAAEKVGDRKLTASSSSCLDSICIVKDPQRVLNVATKAVDGVKSPLVHEALLVWMKSFSVNFGLAALSQGVKDVLVWVLKECESNNIKVKNAACDVVGEMYTQLGPMLESFVKSSDISSTVSSLMDKVFNDNAHDPNANQVERKMKCITMSSSSGPKGGSGRGGDASSVLSLPTTDIMADLKNDCLDRMNDTGDKKSWRNRKDALDEVDAALAKCGGLLSTEGKAFVQLKHLATNLRLRINDSQSNLKPLAASVIGSLLSHLDDTAQAKLGHVVFPALVNAAMNDMKQTMRDAAVSALVLGTDRSKQNGGGINASSVEAFILSLESELSDAALKSSGLPDVLTFLTAKLETLISTNEAEKLSVHRALAKVIVLSLLSSKSGSRSAAEKLLAVCSTNGFVPTASFDKEISKLLPAQQRTVRSFIPKLSKQEQDLVDTFKKASERPRRPGPMPNSSRQTNQVGIPNNTSSLQSSRNGVLPRKSNIIVESEVVAENPLQMSSTRSVKPKAQRLAMMGKGDSWPEYSEEASGDTIQALRKSWALFIPSSSIEVLFPQGGLRSHEDCVNGCDLISKAISYSRDNSDSSFLDMLDFIFKWASCAISLRDHTSGFRKLLAMILDLFMRLDELSYAISDSEALLLLPYLMDKAGVAKLQFKEEILTIFNVVTTKKVYPAQKFGSLTCMKVLEKSKSNPSRPLAAELCLIAVQSAGVPAIGKKGLVILSSALNEETVADVRKVYVDLFEIVVEKLNGDTDKLFSAINPSDKVKAIIMERCVKQPLATHGSPKMLSLTSSSPPRKRQLVSHNSPKSGQEAPALSSSAVVTGNLRARLQKSKESKLSEGMHRLPPSIDTTSVSNSPAPHTPRTTSIDTMYDGIMTDVNWMTQSGECKSTDIVRGTDVLNLLRTIISGDKDSPLDHDQQGAFREKVESDYNKCMITVARYVHIICASQVCRTQTAP
jgi:hypothetical protein